VDSEVSSIEVAVST